VRIFAPADGGGKMTGRKSVGCIAKDKAEAEAEVKEKGCWVIVISHKQLATSTQQLATIKEY
jgi:hypothetical protein